MSKTLVVETNAGSLSVEAPSFVSVKLTPEFIARLKELHGLAKQYDLSEVRCDVVMDWEEIEDDTLVLPELVVTSGQFWFTSELKYAEEETVRSHSISTIDWNYLETRFIAPDDDNLMVVARVEEELRNQYLDALTVDAIA